MEKAEGTRNEKYESERDETGGGEEEEEEEKAWYDVEC